MNDLEPITTQVPSLQDISVEGESRQLSVYRGAGQFPVSPEQAAILARPCEDGELSILPTGEVYLSQVGYRRRLCEAFGTGGWALIPMTLVESVGKTLTQRWMLVAGGRFLAEAIGEVDFQPNNDRMTYGSAVEAAKSNALTRCCKDLIVAAECWDNKFTATWRKKNAVKVERTQEANPKRKRQWRLKSADPFWDEKGRGQRASAEPPTQPPTQSPHPPREQVVRELDEMMHPPTRTERMGEQLDDALAGLNEPLRDEKRGTVETACDDARVRIERALPDTVPAEGAPPPWGGVWEGAQVVDQPEVERRLAAAGGVTTPNADGLSAGMRALIETQRSRSKIYANPQHWADLLGKLGFESLDEVPRSAVNQVLKALQQV